MTTSATHTLIEEFAENIAQVTHVAEAARETFRTETAETARTSCSAVHTGFTEAVIGGAFLFVTQHFVGFADFLKFRFGLFIPIVAVGVIFHG